MAPKKKSEEDLRQPSIKKQRQDISTQDLNSQRGNQNAPLPPILAAMLSRSSNPVGPLDTGIGSAAEVIPRMRELEKSGVRCMWHNVDPAFDNSPYFVGTWHEGQLQIQDSSNPDSDVATYEDDNDDGSEEPGKSNRNVKSRASSESPLQGMGEIPWSFLFHIPAQVSTVCGNPWCHNPNGHHLRMCATPNQFGYAR